MSAISAKLVVGGICLQGKISLRLLQNKPRKPSTINLLGNLYQTKFVCPIILFMRNLNWKNGPFQMLFSILKVTSYTFYQCCFCTLLCYGPITIPQWVAHIIMEPLVYIRANNNFVVIAGTAHTSYMYLYLNFGLACLLVQPLFCSLGLKKNLFSGSLMKWCCFLETRNPPPWLYWKNGK